MCEALIFLLDNIYIRLGTKLFRQIVGIPMGTNCAPLVADLFLFCYERDFMISLSVHYENAPIQIYRQFYLQKTENFQIKNSDIFHISAQNIDCGYSLEPPLRGGSNEYPQSIF